MSNKKKCMIFLVFLFCSVILSLFLNSKDSELVPNEKRWIETVQKKTEVKKDMIQRESESYNKINVINNIEQKDITQRVEKALEGFQTEIQKIPAGATQMQLDQIKAKTKEVEKIQTPLPVITVITDEYGMKWKKLAYSTGDVRYEIAE